MINPHGINGVLGKRWCSKRRKRTRKAVVSSSKKKRLSERMALRLQGIYLEPYLRGIPYPMFFEILHWVWQVVGSEWQKTDSSRTKASGWIRTTRHILVDKWQRISPTGFPLKFCARKPLQASFLAYIVSCANRFFNLFQKKDSTVGWVCQFCRRRHFSAVALFIL